MDVEIILVGVLTACLVIAMFVLLRLAFDEEIKARKRKKKDKPLNGRKYRSHITNEIEYIKETLENIQDQNRDIKNIKWKSERQ